MKTWALHARGKARPDGKVDPLCGQQTGYGSKGCDQALFGGKWAKVTCKKCLRLPPAVLAVPHSLCERCGEPPSSPSSPTRGKKRVRCERCKRLICRGCAERDFEVWWCSSDQYPRASSPTDCYDAERRSTAKHD